MKLLPQSLAGRLILTLIIGLLIAQVLGSLLILRDRQKFLREFSGQQTADRIISVVTLLEQQPKSSRSQIIKAASSPGLRIRLADRARPVHRHTESDETFVEYLAQNLPRHPTPIVSIDTLTRKRDGFRPMSRHPGPIRDDGLPLPPLHRYLIQVELTDGSWVLFQHRLPKELSGWPLRLFGYLGILLISIIVLSVIVVRQITHPLATLSAAAERLGKDINNPPLEEKGSREVQQAATAFNNMQRRLQRYIEDRSQLLAAVSHDLKTPITRLRLRSELLENPELEAKFNADLQEMEEMVQATLDFMQGTESKEPVATIDMNGLMETLEDDAVELGWTVEQKCQQIAPLQGRPLALKRCIWNLIENAVRYAGSATLEAWDEADKLVILVLDEGPGIPSSDLESIFEPFQRGEKSRNRDQGGTGLGLSIARNIARAHGGDIILFNRQQGGLEARITLPR